MKKIQKKSYLKFIQSEKGSTMLGASLLIFSFFLLCVLLLKLEVISFANIIEKQKAYLCTKKYNFAEINYIEMIEKLNKVIVTGSGLELIGIIIPIFKAVGKNVKKAAMYTQLYKSYKYRYGLMELHRDGCSFLPTALLTPYKFKLKLERDSIDRAILRRKVWNNIIGHKKRLLRTRTYQENKTFKQQTWDLKTKEVLSL